jgi:hypothetical protein
MSRIFLLKSKLGDDLEEVKKKHKVVREQGNEVVVVAEGEDAKELTSVYEGLEEINE